MAATRQAQGPTSGRRGRRRSGARVSGTVQGVGFRPFVFRLAGELELGGFILNDEHGVVLEVEGEPGAVEKFFARLVREAPPLASVEQVARFDADALGTAEFEILSSTAGGEPEALVTPDAATCDDCLAELFDPADRRHRYPFINCTNCGPRFTIVLGVPYDRAQTTMARFEMCPACRAEYEDPRDRRFHAQPNACPACGPAVRLLDAAGSAAPLEGAVDPVAAAAAALASGAVLAVKGIGGYHLACRAEDGGAVASLRARKHREDKPFALMAPSPETARRLVALTPHEEALLLGRERPIVIARRLAGAPVADAVAPGSRDLGVMLPYSPLHHLLLADAGTTLVMTSGNRSDEPIAHGDADAAERLAGIADLFLVGDRDIHMRTDDSVVRSLDVRLRPQPLLMRRSRGYVPAATPLPADVGEPLLGCGAELKSTFCVSKGRLAWVGHHIGDLKNWETLTSFRDGIDHFQRLFAVEPQIVAHDLHPDYLSTKYALDRADAEPVGVQHHHAHLAACLAEHAVAGPALGALYDGSGYGLDGSVWGGELLAGDLAGFSRFGMLFPVRLAGGDAAVREPWRLACAWLAAATGESVPALPASLRGEVGGSSWAGICELLRSGLNAPSTSSVGRLFDGVAALLGIRARVNYEGQAAAELEGAADPAERGAYPMPLASPAALDAEPGPAAEAAGVNTVIDARETVRALLEDRRRGAPVELAAARFHNALAAASVEALAREAEARGICDVVLSGGVFQNRLLLERAATGLRARRLRPLIPLRLPPNDGGIAYGQVAVAAGRRARAS